MTNEDNTELPISRLTFDEISGKNAAIHAYDTLIWRIRAGFLTIMLAIWGLAFGSTIEYRLVPSLFVISMGIAISAAVIDISYVRRQFRVINDLNRLLEVVASADRPDDLLARRPELLPCLRISGNSGDASFASGGYASAINVAQWVYATPIVSIILASILFIAAT